MGVLHQVEDDIGFRIVGVEAFVCRGIVILQQDDRVLALADLHIGAALVGTHHEGLRPGSGTASCRIDVDGNEQVGVVAVGDVAAFRQFDEAVGLAGIDDFYVRILLFDALAQPQGQVEVDLLLRQLAVFRDGAGIVAAVSCVDHHGTETDAAALCVTDSRKQGEKKGQKPDSGPQQRHISARWHASC